MCIEVVGGRKSNNRDGMTLVEIMVALTILVFTIIFAARLGQEASALNRRAKREADAKAIAFQFSEIFKTLPPSDTSLKNDGDNADLDDITTPDHEREVIFSGHKFHVMWDVADDRLYDSLVVGVKTIRIHVIWGRDENGNKLDYALTVVRRKNL